MSSQTRNPEDTFEILVATDIHLGYEETDPVRGEDSFTSFEEILHIAQERNVDFILLGGDLFHDNKPSMNSMHKCLALLRKYCMGDKPVSVEFLSDADDVFNHCPTKYVNYEDPNLNISIPVFSIHGNHDDPCGHNCLGSMDVLCATGHINYFSKWTDLSQVKVSPLLMRKGSSKLCIYGLSHIKDERLARLFRDRKVEFRRPSEDKDNWCNIMVLHQNRVDRGLNQYIKEVMLPHFLQLVVWGHEHESRPQPEYSCETGFRVVQPGSSVATSLSEGEATAKHAVLVKVNGLDTFVEPIELQTVRPFIFNSVSLKDMTFRTNNVANEVQGFLSETVDNMLRSARDLVTGHKKQPKLPLLRLRVDYTKEVQYFNPIRFGQRYIDRVANPVTMIALTRDKTGSRSKKVDNFDSTAMDSALNTQETLEDIGSKVERVIEKYFLDKSNPQQMNVLSVNGMNEAVSRFIEKDDKEALKAIIEHQKKKTMEHLLKAETLTEETIMDCITSFREMRTSKSTDKQTEELREMLEDEEMRSILVEGGGSDSDTATTTTSSRGRGRGRGRGKAATRAAPKAQREEVMDVDRDSDENFSPRRNTRPKVEEISDSEEESVVTAPPRSRGRAAPRGAAKPTRARGARGTAKAQPSTRGRGRTSQASIADIFSNQMSSSPAKRRKMTFESDSD